MSSGLETFNVDEEIELDVSNLLRKRYLLHTRKQVEGENFNYYYKDLECLFKLCEFKDESILRDHVVFGIKDCGIREQLLEHDNPSLEIVVEICRSRENRPHASEIDYVKNETDLRRFSAEYAREESQCIKTEDEDSSEDLGYHNCNSPSFTESSEPKIEPVDDDRIMLMGATALHRGADACDADLLDPLALPDANYASDTGSIISETNSVTKETTDSGGTERHQFAHTLKDHDYMSSTFTEICDNLTPKPKPDVCDASADLSGDSDMCETKMDTGPLPCASLSTLTGTQQESASKFKPHVKVSSEKKEINTERSNNTPKIIMMCKFCKKIFLEQDLRIHMLSHKQSDLYRTLQQPLQISQSDIPLVTSTLGQSSYACDEICDSGAASVQPDSHWLPDDLILTGTDDPLSEDICAVSKNKEENVSSTEGLYSPALTQARENPHVCYICSREYVQAKRLRAHMIFRHNGDKPYRCLLCSMTFKYRLMLNFHTRMHHKQICNVPVRVQDLQTESLDVQNTSVLDHNSDASDSNDALDSGATSVHPETGELISNDSHWLPDDLI